MKINIILMTMLGFLTIAAAIADDSAVKVYNDFDGDRRSDPAIYYPGSGVWEIFQTKTLTIRTEQLGVGACLPVPGDFDGDGKADIVVFDSTTACWYGKLSGGQEGCGVFGWPGNWPVPGDYDGDGITDVAVYDQMTGIWTVLLSKTKALAAGKWGYLGDFRPWENPQTYTVLPMPYDFNQDGIDDLAIYYRGLSMADSGWDILYVGLGTEEHYTWGSSGSLPVPGRYQVPTPAPRGVCVYKISTAEWAIPYRKAFCIGNYGQTLPVPAGDYDGNGFDDNAVYNYENGLWTVVFNTGSTPVDGRMEFSFTFGGPNAVPANIYSTLYSLARYSPKPW